MCIIRNFKIYSSLILQFFKSQPHFWSLQSALQDAARRLDRKLEKAAEKLDRKLNQAEQKADSWMNKRLDSARKTYRKYVLGDSSKITVDEMYMLNMYIMAFCAGTMLGVGTGKIV